MSAPLLPILLALALAAPARAAGAVPSAATADSAGAAVLDSLDADSTAARIAAPDRLRPGLALGRAGFGPGELAAPAGLAVGPRGRVFVADPGNHRVVCLDSTGAVVREFGGFGYDPNRFDRPTDVVVGGTLSAWVLDRGNARVVKYDIDGRFVGVVVDFRDDALRARLGVVEPGGLAADQGGQLFVSDMASDRILVFDPLGAVLTVRGGFGAQEGRFHDPTGVAVDVRGRLLVADGGNRRVQLLDSFGGPVAAWPIEPGMTAAKGLRVAFAPGGGFALCDPATGRVALYEDAGTLAALHAPSGGRDLWADGIAFDDGGRLYAADPRAGRVVRLTRVGASP